MTPAEQNGCLLGNPKRDILYRDLGDLRPIRFQHTKRNSVFESNNYSLLGSGMQSTIARDNKQNLKPIDIMKATNLKDSYLNTLDRVN